MNQNSNPNNKDKTVLIVDDEPDLVELLSDFFERAGFKILTAGGGREAFEIIKKNPVHAVVSDIRMGKGDGIELLENIKKHCNPMPSVFFLSGFSDVSPEQVMAKGASGIFSKPIDWDTLKKSVLQHIQNIKV